MNDTTYNRCLIWILVHANSLTTLGAFTELSSVQMIACLRGVFPYTVASDLIAFREKHSDCTRRAKRRKDQGTLAHLLSDIEVHGEVDGSLQQLPGAAL